MATPSTTLGPYRLLERLGQGGMGEVYLAEHAQTRARFALKLLSGGLDEDELARFEREAQAMAAVDGHPYLVRVHAFGREGARAYLVQQLIEGRDLARALQERGRLPPAEAAALVAQVARGVSHAHQRGVLHRDLKPANVLLDRRGQPKVTDFGLAHVEGATTLTRTGEVLGTPVYMAPEQARAEPCDERTDVYGLGALLFACLTGRPPLEGRGSVLATLDAVASEPPAPPSSLEPGVPPWLDELCLRALSKEPAQRYPSARALAEALERRGGAGVPAPGARLRLWAALAAVIGAGLLGAALASAPAGASAGASSPGGGRASSAAPSRPALAGPPLPRAGDPGLAELSAGELFARIEQALAWAEGRRDEELAAAARLELLRASLRRCHLDEAEERAGPLLARPAQRAEAHYLCGVAAILGQRPRAARRHLEGAAREPGFWGGLARLELEARGAGAAGGEQELRARAEELRAQAEGHAAVYVERARVLVTLRRPDPSRLRQLQRRFPDDAALIVGLVELDCRDVERPGGELLDLLERARVLCAPAHPPHYRELRIGVEAIAGRTSAALELLAREHPGASPALLRLRLGERLELCERPLVAQSVWRGLSALGKGTDAARYFEQARPPFQLRVTRALGLPLTGVRLDPRSRVFLAAWQRELPPGLGEQAGALLEAASHGSSWRFLQARLERLGRAHPGPEFELLAAELAIGRGAEGRGQVHVQRARAAGADPLRCFVLGGSAPATLQRERGARRTIGLACQALRQGRRGEALRLLADPFPADAPAWAARARWYLLVLASSRASPQQAELYETQALGALGLARGLIPFLSAWRQLLADLIRGKLERVGREFRLLVSLLRIDEGAPTRAQLASLLTLLPEPLRREWEKSSVLWAAETEAALRQARADAGRVPGAELAVAPLERALAQLRALQLLAEGGSREQVEAAWRGHGPPRGQLGELTRRRYRERFGREPGR